MRKLTLLLSLLLTAVTASAQPVANTVSAKQSGAWSVTVGSSALPTGAATSALQTTGNTSLASIDGKIVVVDTGNVTVGSSALPTGAATAANQATEITSLQLLDDAVNTVTAADGTKGVAVLGSDSAQARFLRTDSSGRLVTIVAGSAGNMIDATTGTPSTGAQGLIVRIAPGNGANDLGKQEDLPAADSDLGVAVYGRRLDMTGAAAGLTGAIGDYSAHGVDINGRLVITGQVNSGASAANTYAPVQVGGYAVGTDKALVDDTDVVHATFDLSGRTITAPYANPENYISGVLLADITDTTSTQVIAAQAGERTYITGISITNTNATVGTRVDVLSGATVLWTCMAPAGGGCTWSSGGVPLRGASATAINIQPATTGAEIRAAVNGFTLNN